MNLEDPVTGSAILFYFLHYSMKNISLIVIQARTDEPLLRVLRTAKNELDRFFKIKLDLPLLVLLSSRHQFNIFWGQQTENWMMAWARNSVIYALRLKAIRRHNLHYSIADYHKLLKHEHAHLYINTVGQAEAMPKWLKEGLACWIANQKKRIPDQARLESVFRPDEINPKDTYAIGYAWVDRLLRSFGKNKFLALIQRLEGRYSLAQFRKTFRAVYGLPWSRQLLNRKHSRSNN